MVKKTKAGKSRITLGDIKKGIASGSPSPKIDAVARELKAALFKQFEVMAAEIDKTQLKTYAPQAKNSNAVQKAYEKLTTVEGELRKTINLFVISSSRAKRLLAVADGADNKDGIDTVIEKIQTEINNDSPLTAQQVLFLIMEARGIDVGSVGKEMAKKWESYIKQNQENARQDRTYPTEDKKKWLDMARDLSDINSEISNTGLAKLIVNMLIHKDQKGEVYSNASIQTVRKYLDKYFKK